LATASATRSPRLWVSRCFSKGMTSRTRTSRLLPTELGALRAWFAPARLRPRRDPPAARKAHTRAKESTVAGRGHFPLSADPSYARTR
jgi:hypothetical protein